MSADGDFCRSVRAVTDSIIEQMEHGDIELSEIPDLFKSAAAWLRIQDEQRREWLWGSSPDPADAEERRIIEAGLNEQLFPIQSNPTT